MELSPGGTSLVLPPDGVGALWFSVKWPVAPPSILRIYIIALKRDAPADRPNVIDQMIFNWYPETEGRKYEEHYRLEIRQSGNISVAVALTDLDDAPFKAQKWDLTVTQQFGPPTHAVPPGGEQPEYIVSGSQSTAGPGVNFFFSGAGHDVEGTGYIEGFRRAFAVAGIGNFTDVNVSSGTRATDVTSTMALYQGPTQQTIPSSTSVEKGLGTAGLPQPGQRNLIGYSFGGSVAAAVASTLADRGVRVDNLVLIGTAVSIPFLRSLQTSSQIGRVVVVKLPGDVVRPGTSPATLAAVLTPVVGGGSIQPHFSFAEGEVNQLRREQLARLLVDLGIR